ncbi:MAG: Fur family transcriptional regulator [Microbacteriaceae bacterium]
MNEQAHHHIRSAGLRVTGGRVALLEALESRPHSNADTLYRALKPTLPGTSVQAVHNMLGDLTAAGVIRRIEPAGSAALYESRVDDNHHHVVCDSCGAIEDVDCSVGHAPCLVPVTTSGFTIASAEVVYWGTCPQCRDAA